MDTTRVSAGVLSTNDASAKNEPLEEELIPLKVLSTPKPPSPALYFTRQESVSGSNAINKKDLSVSKHQAMGRKYYLHAQRKKDNPKEVQQLNEQGQHPSGSEKRGYPWASQHPKKRQEMKVRVKPIITGTSFYFHLDFSNLTEWELGLLCFSLRPDDKFRHKLGMGKPIGLGTVRIDFAGLHLIDRNKRYIEDEPEDSRYNQGGWTTSDSALREELVKAGYDIPEKGIAPDPTVCREHFRKTMDPDILRALELLGDPNNVVAPVHYPQVKGGDIEDENFKWFVDNDGSWYEALTELKSDTPSLPVLNRREKQR